MKLLVYKAVFGPYDRVFPPVTPEAGVDYVIVTDDATTRVPGWRTHVVDPAPFGSPKAANLHYRALIHRELPGYNASLYSDGNIRLLGSMSRFMEPFLASGAALGVYPHPLRTTVADEIEACIAAGKTDAARLRAEWDEYRGLGFPDDVGLIETTIMLRNHAAPDLDPAMALWNDLFQRHQTRDQISLPFVQWKVGFSRHDLHPSFRQPNPWFGLYPHRGARDVSPLYADLFARSYDSVAHRLALAAWNGWRAARRGLKGAAR